MSGEQQFFDVLNIWKRQGKFLPPASLFSPKSLLYPLFQYLYALTKQEYELLPLRKNGEDSFLHPLHVVYYLTKAKVKDELTLCLGIIHDLIEERVDRYKLEEKIEDSSKGLQRLWLFEQQASTELEQDLKNFCKDHDFPADACRKLMEALTLLTRRKQDFYYQSIAAIFLHKDATVKEMAIQVKLADRMHNVLCIENFTEEQRLYECSKNLFILNNTKKYLLDTPGRKGFPASSSVERLFTQCCKATYDAYLPSFGSEGHHSGADDAAAGV